jgi:hypothetical protein
MHTFFTRAFLLALPLMPFQQDSGDPERRAMLEFLGASAPHRSLGAQGELFDRFVGTWDVDYSQLTSGGSWQRSRGELRFGWILDGTAIQDVWTVHGTAGGRTSGTTVRFYDATKKCWRVTFIAPAFHAVVQLEGGAEAENIVLRGPDTDGIPDALVLPRHPGGLLHLVG